MASESIGKDSSCRTSGQATPSSANDLGIMSSIGADLLSEAETAL